MPIDIIPDTLAPHWHDEARVCIAATILATNATLGRSRTIRPRVGPLAGETLDEPDAVDLGRRLLECATVEETTAAIADWADEAVTAWAAWADAAEAHELDGVAANDEGQSDA